MHLYRPASLSRVLWTLARQFPGLIINLGNCFSRSPSGLLPILSNFQRHLSASVRLKSPQSNGVDLFCMETTKFGVPPGSERRAIGVTSRATAEFLGLSSEI